MDSFPIKIDRLGPDWGVEFGFIASIAGGCCGPTLGHSIRIKDFTGDNTVEEIDGLGGTNKIAGTNTEDNIDLSETKLYNWGRAELTI